MGGLRDKFLAKINTGGESGSKKSVENLVVFVIILVVTIIFINYIWGADKNKKKNQSTLDGSKIESTQIASVTLNKEESSLDCQIENLLRSLEGVEDVKVLITYNETNKVIPMYNEDNAQSVTKEEDTQRWCKNNK